MDAGLRFAARDLADVAGARAPVELLRMAVLDEYLEDFVLESR